jgi:signal transduction histidine kinase
MLSGRRAGDVVALGAVVLVGAWAWSLSSEAASPALAAGLSLLAAALLLLRQRMPVVTLLGLLAALILLAQVAGYPGPDDPYLVMLTWAAYSVGRYAPVRHQPWAAFAVLLLVAGNATEASGPADIVFPFIIGGLPWIGGLALQLGTERADRAEQRAEVLNSEILETAARAETEERLRIAREMHDVIGHSLTGLSLQIQVLRRRAAAGRAAEEDDLRALESIAHELLDEVRGMVGLLADSATPLRPAPCLEDLPELIHRSARSGQELALLVHGEPRPIPPAISATALRIAQECLTNARRHGGDGPVDLVVTWGPRSVQVEASNPMPAHPSPPDHRQGHGLLSMRERARVHGGHVHVDATDERWYVRATLPTPVVEAAP